MIEAPPNENNDALAASKEVALDDRIRYLPMVLVYQEPKYPVHNREERRRFEHHLVSQARYKIRLYLDKEARGAAHGKPSNASDGGAGVVGRAVD